MADMEKMLNWAGFDSSWDLIQSKMSEKDLKDLFMELWHECDYQNDIVSELIHDEGFVDLEQVKADAEDASYQAWKDRDLD
jgi:hypothetical protein